MSHVFLAVNGDNVGEHIGNAIANDDHNSLSKISSSVKSAHDMLDKWVQSRGGKVVVSSGDEGIYQIPQQYIQELEAIKNRYNKMAGTTLTVGVGSTMSEASKALIYGKMNDKNQVVHYEPGIEDYIAGDEQEELPNPDEVTEDGNQFKRQSEGAEGEDESEEVSDEDSQEGEESDEDSEMPLDEAVDEHEELVDTLESPSHKDDKKEAKKQNKELTGLKSKQAVSQEIDEDEEDESSENQPEHEEDMSSDEDFNHDAQENQDDEEDEDNIEADEEEEALGEQTPPNRAKTNKAPAQEESEEGEDFDESIPSAEDEDYENEEDQAQFDADIDEDEQQLGDEDELEEVSNEDELSPEMEGEQSSDEDGMVEDDFSDEDPSFDGEQSSDEMSDEDMAADHNGVLNEMLHANMGEEGADDMSPEAETPEDSEDEIKQDIIESLMAFRQNKEHLEQLKQTNPELYQANILMLRSMIQLAKKFNLNPEAAFSDASAAQDMENQFPTADGEEPQDEEVDQLAMMGKSEKGVHKPYMSGGESFAGEMARTGKKDKNPVRQDMARKLHSQKIKEIKEIKPNLPKSEKGINIASTKRPKGISDVGAIVRNPRKDVYGESKINAAKTKIKQATKEARNIKPNLPKSEDMGKSESYSRNIWHPKKMKQGESVHFEGKHYKVHSQREKAQSSANSKSPRYYTTLVPHKEESVKKAKVEEMKIDLKKKPDVKKQ